MASPRQQHEQHQLLPDLPLPESAREAVAAKKKDLETMEVRFEIEYDIVTTNGAVWTQLRAIRSMADPLDLCEVSWRTRTDYHPPTWLPRDGMEVVTRDGNPRARTIVGPWVTSFSVPVRGMEALRHLVLTMMKGTDTLYRDTTDDISKVSVILLMGGKLIRRDTVSAKYNEDMDDYESYVTPQSVLDTADSMLIFMCRNGARVP